MADASAMAQHAARVERGAAAVRVYLQLEFIGHAVEALQPSSRDAERGVRSFRVQRDVESRLLRVPEEVLEMGTAEVFSLLQRHRAAHALRQMDSGTALLVATDGVRAESA